MAIKIDKATWGGASEKWKMEKAEKTSKELYKEGQYTELVASLDSELEEIDGDIEKLQEKIKALEQEAQHVKELRSAVNDIPVLFDTDSFDELNDHISLLKEAGVKKIQIGNNPDNNLTIEDIRSFIKGVVGDYSRPRTQEALVKGELTQKTVDKALSARGITADKISSKSTQGLRECLAKCVITMVQQPVDQTGVVTRDSILGSDLRNIKELRKKIQDKQ